MIFLTKKCVKTRTLLICLSFLFIQVVVSAQSANTCKLKGRITDNLNAPIPFASVYLLNLKDSSITNATSADENGHYLFERIYEGQYLINVKAIGFKDKMNITFQCSSGNKNDSQYNIILLQDEKLLEEVVVTDRKPPIQIKGDRIVVNVAQSINATGTNVLELLRKSPGVRVMDEKGIMLDGKSGILVYLDGTLITFGEKEIIELFENMQSSNIETIEIITNPSSKYDAVGKAGIINIKTKKNTKRGFNSNISLSANFGSYNPKYSSGLSLNYGSKTVNAYGNYNYNTGNNKFTSDYFRRQKDDKGLLTNFDQFYYNIYRNDGHNFKTGIDFFFTPKSTFGVVIDGNIADRNSSAKSVTLISHTPDKIDSQLVARNIQDRKSMLMGYNANYRYADSTARELIVNANYLNFNLNSDSYQPNTYFDDSEQPIRQTAFRNYNTSKIYTYSIKTDYQQKLWKGILNTGFKINHTKSDNFLDFYNVSSEDLRLDSAKTNQFSYSENIIAGYVEYQMTIEKWKLSIGARGEQTSSNGVLNTFSNNGDNTVKKNYFNLFPNARINYNINNHNSLDLGYNTRIDRPAYQDLNPFEFVQDELSYIKGNPFLQPELTQITKLSHIFKNYLTTSFSYTDTKDYSIFYRDTVDRGKTFVTKVNVAHQKTYNLSAFLQWTVRDWWDLNYSLNVFRQSIEGQINKKILDMSQNAWSFSSSNTFKFLNSWSIELSGFYNSKYMDVPAIVKPQWSVDVGMQKKVLKDAGIIRLAVSDIFNSLDFSLGRDFGGLYYTNKNKWESQQLKLSFNYKLGSQHVKGPTNKETGTKEEKKRMN